MKLGMGEILVVLLVALFVLGPDKLPSYARKLGNALRAFRDAANETTEGIRENIIEPLNEAQQPLREALEPVEEMQQAIDQNVKDVKKSIKEITTPITSNKPVPDEPISEQKAEPAEEPETSGSETAAMPDTPETPQEQSAEG